MSSVQTAVPAYREPVQKEKKKGISGSTIKMIAVAAMLIDHIAAALLTRLLIVRGILEINASDDMTMVMQWLAENAGLYYITMAMRMIGRLGFPIFCFLLVEGFQKTRSVKKYALRLGLFALLSEIPFDLAVSGTVLEFGYQNVYFTLVLGILALWAVSWLSGHELPVGLRWIVTVLGFLAPAGYGLWMMGTGLVGLIIGGILLVGTAVILILYGKKRGLPDMQKICACIVAVAAAMALADLLRTDYGGMGVLTIAAMYLFREGKVKSMLAGCVVLAVMSLSELPAFLALIPVAFYNGERGLKMKYFFYLFYPVHLLLIWLAALLMGMGWISAI